MNIILLFDSKHFVKTYSCLFISRYIKEQKVIFYLILCTSMYIIQRKLESDKRIPIDIPDGGGSKPVHTTEPDPVKPNMPMIPVTRL